MRAVLTRVKSASVSVDGKTIGSIGPGFLILLGVTMVMTVVSGVDYVVRNKAVLAGAREKTP